MDARGLPSLSGARMCHRGRRGACGLPTEGTTCQFGVDVRLLVDPRSRRKTVWVIAALPLSRLKYKNVTFVSRFVGAFS